MNTMRRTYLTEAGELVAQHTTDDLRRKTLQPVQTYANGTVKSLPLEERTPVFTPLGIVEAELVTFYKSGKLKRVFPLNGKLSGYWTQEDEGKLVDPLTIDTPAGPLTARVISLCFYEDGKLRSLTLWPDENITVQTPVGAIKTRVGISFSPGGRIRSLEPAQPTPLKTRIGKITAFDSDAVGINGDLNSLVFDNEGQVASLCTSLSMVSARHYSGAEFIFVPESRESLCSESEQEMVPMRMLFDDQGMEISVTPDAEPSYVDFAEYEISTAPYLPQLDNLSKGLICSV
ncbi:hypothetical protein [Desulfovibrio sp. JC010]|uniref:hypothetical protein n=1 Tax=Desulfovibrio sp. JC010 TaxID=2593641 RepID=UPI0013D88466|nr:hypothetical protein [Desulfovibrio sp. JC010]NDV26744.1 hypothetical protein [Desulfovibrio sp. JC010]